jgi:hypothetical protein
MWLETQLGLVNLNHLLVIELEQLDDEWYILGYLPTRSPLDPEIFESLVLFSSTNKEKAETILKQIRMRTKTLRIDDL